jgi:hypothetical protein
MSYDRRIFLFSLFIYIWSRHGDSKILVDMEEKLGAVQKELRNVRGKEVFNQNVHDLCLVPDVVIPHKFKTPTFEKYTGETCP